MQFAKAVEFLSSGIKIRRKCWNDEFLRTVGKVIEITKEKSFHQLWSPDVDDLLAEDWEKL